MNSRDELNFYFVPCNYLHNSDDTVSQDCISDLEAQQTFLGSFQSVLYINVEVLDTEFFGDNAIKRESKLYFQQINEKEPSWYIVPI